MQARADASKLLHQVIHHGKSLADLKPQFTDPHARHLAHGVLRYLESLQSIANQLLKKPLKDKQLNLLLLVGLFQLIHDDTPAYAAINSTVSATTALKKKWGRSVINFALRQYTRTPVSCANTPSCQYNQPNWLIKRIEQAWPGHSHDIFHQQLIQAPLDLRVNTATITVNVFLSMLQQAGIVAELIPDTCAGVRIKKAKAVDQLPGYEQGWFWVQDPSGQIAADCIRLSPGDHILDACAAPGSKTASLLSRLPEGAKLTAIDTDASRLQRLQTNNKRLGMNAMYQQLDSTTIATHYPQMHFDIILCDAPCSATGIIRRHPDIPYLRRDRDIATLCQTQKALLDALWQVLKPNGILYYTTCSILPDENEVQAQKFLNRHTDAVIEPLCISQTIESVALGHQRLPQTSHDGFYCVAFKKANT